MIIKLHNYTEFSDQFLRESVKKFYPGKKEGVNVEISIFGSLAAAKNSPYNFCLAPSDEKLPYYAAAFNKNWEYPKGHGLSRPLQKGGRKFHRISIIIDRHTINYPTTLYDIWGITDNHLYENLIYPNREYHLLFALAHELYHIFQFENSWHQKQEMRLRDYVHSLISRRAEKSCDGWAERCGLKVLKEQTYE